LPRKPEPELRALLREWILRKNPKVKPEDLRDDTPLLASGTLKSMQVMELILWLEKNAEAAIDVENLKPGTFQSIDVISKKFFAAG
jgi:aryl carrier-like protein